MSNKALTPHFSVSEMQCRCGCGEGEMDMAFMQRLEAARVIAAIPFTVTSGFRCSERNAAVGGKPTSAHLSGIAADIAATTSRRRFTIMSALLNVGFTRIGIAADFIHADWDKTKTPRVAWLYTK